MDVEWLDVGVGCREWMDVGVGGEFSDVGVGDDDVQMEVVWLDTGVQSPGGGIRYSVVRLHSSLGHVVLSSMLKK